MIKRIAKSAMYRAFGLLCYDPLSEKVIPADSAVLPPGWLMVSPQQSIIDPKVFGTYDLASARAVPKDDPLHGSFSLDCARDAMLRSGLKLDNDRYRLAISMLEPGSGICLDACTGSPREDVRADVERKGYAYLPIDIAPPEGIRREDLTELSFTTSSIARIISCDTIEHIPHYPAAVAEMFRVLEPDGYLIIHFPVYYFDKANGVPIADGIDPWGHVRYFSAREMLELFQRTGFAIMRAHFNFDYGALLAVLGKGP
jgi:hypothetical protein